MRYFIVFILFITINIYSSDKLSIIAQEESVVEIIEVTGNNIVSTNFIKQVINIKEGEKFKSEQLEKNFQMLIGLNIFDEINSKVEIREGSKGKVIDVYVYEIMPQNRGDEAAAQMIYSISTKIIYSTSISPSYKYVEGLHLLRKAIELKPNYKEALEEKDQIENIYRAMGRPIPE